VLFIIFEQDTNINRNRNGIVEAVFVEGECGFGV